MRKDNTNLQAIWTQARVFIVWTTHAEVGAGSLVSEVKVLTVNIMGSVREILHELNKKYKNSTKYATSKVKDYI